MGDPLGGVGIFPGLASEPGDRFVVSGCGPGVVDGDLGVRSEGDSFEVFSEIVENVLTEDDGDGFLLGAIFIVDDISSDFRADFDFMIATSLQEVDAFEVLVDFNRYVIKARIRPETVEVFAG